MGTLKLDIEKTNGIGNFGIWRKKMKAVMVNKKSQLLLMKLHSSKKPQQLKRHEILDTTFTSIILNLSNAVLRQVNDEATTHELWNKLKALI